MSLAAIVRALGGDLYAGGRRANVPAPGHSPADRSVSLLLDGDRVIVHAFAGDDWRDVLRELRRLGLVDADGRLGRGAAPGAPEPPGRSQRRAVAAALWEDARPVPGTLAERHARRRRIGRALPEALRFHPAAPVRAYGPGGGPTCPALLAAVREPGGALCAVEVTYLSPAGNRARLRLPRKTIGLLPQGCAVRLDPAGRVMVVAEGVFSALSAGERFGLPAWALLSAGRLVAWRPPPEARRILVAGDRDRVGEDAASTLAARLRAAGVEAVVRLPPAPFRDWNEAADPP
ncbi:DUF7146 domain-containing protein, partial [Phenylobacterium sp.]|uniref:DUF7146 domain-containing protein n=1 Tax=Phenylobacterium sp. TaxID=1871053 RepID=UPI002FDF0F99